MAEMMNDHLPECECYGRNHGECALCICERLRACEQRVREEVNAEWWGKSPYRQGVQAAREAVASARGADIPGAFMDRTARFIWLDDALAAIDALREGTDTK